VEEQTPSWTEKRLYPRTHVSGKVSFKAYWPSDDLSRYLYHTSFGDADLIDISYGGMRIKTFVPIDQRYLLEIIEPSPVKQMSVVWVKKIYNYVQAGLKYMCQVD
jgi:hypothetical protein